MDVGASQTQRALTAEGAIEGKVHGLALDVARQLGCAVIAMRYPVVDDFAVGFNLALYRSMWEKGSTVAAAVGLAIEEAAPLEPTSSAPALSAYTPSLLASGVPDLLMQPPTRTELVGDEVGNMVGFEAEPDRFVGRVEEMIRANAALAEKSGRTGVIFYGMAGSGKTACALEVAYGQRDNFSALIFSRCPPDGADAEAVTAALTRLALRLDAIVGTHLADEAHDQARFQNALGSLGPALLTTSTLVVVDNAESLITDAGTWRDVRWEQLISALTRHGGRSRLILTSRRPPQPAPDGMVPEAISVLSRDEALMLSRQLPHLPRLLADVSADGAQGRELVRRVLEATGGHPKMMELADAQAEDGSSLDAMLTSAELAWTSAGVDRSRFLTDRDVTDDPVATFAKILQDWTVKVVTALDEPVLLMIMLLCRCDRADRTWAIIDAIWGDLWRLLNKPDPAPDPGPILHRLAGLALVDISRLQEGPVVDQYEIHPQVAATVSAGTPAGVADVIDRVLATYWQRTVQRSLTVEGGGRAAGRFAGPVLLQATRQATVYLMRIKEWGDALGDIENGLIMRDRTTDALTEAIRLYRTISAAAVGTYEELRALGLLGNALMYVDPAEAEPILKDVETRSTSASNYRLAVSIAGDLVTLYRLTARYPDALAAADRKVGYTERAGLGPWSKLNNQVQRVEVLRSAGDYPTVFNEAIRLSHDLDSYPAPLAGDNLGAPWNIRETLYDLGRSAAMVLGRWNPALDWANRRVQSMTGRGAPELEIAKARFDTYPALRNIGTGAVKEMLDACRPVFERHEAYLYLSRCIGGLATLEFEGGQRDQALNYGRLALRLGYLDASPSDLAARHHQFADSLYQWQAGPAAPAHRVAALMLLLLADDPQYHDVLGEIARESDSGLEPPVRFDELCRLVEQVQGVHFAEQVVSLGGGQDTLVRVLAEARAIPPEQLYAFDLERFEATALLIVFAGRGDPHASAQLAEAIDELEAAPETHDLALRLRRIIAGEVDASVLTAGLHRRDAVRVARAVDAATGRVEAQPIPGFLRPMVNAAVAVARHPRHPEEAVPSPDQMQGLRSNIDQLGSYEEWQGLGRELRRLLDGSAGEVKWDDLGTTGTAIMILVSHWVQETS